MSKSSRKSYAQTQVHSLIFLTFVLYSSSGLASEHDSGSKPLLHRIVRAAQQHKMCNVSHIGVQRNFDIKRFMGKWYDVARTKNEEEEFSRTSAVSEYQLDSEGQILIRYTGIIDGQCTPPVKVVARQDEQIASKLTIEPTQQQENFFLNGSYWIIETNYDYALVYGCKMLRHDGACMENNELVYVISRAPVLSTVMLSRVLFIVKHRLCVNISQLTIDQHTASCPVDEPEINQSYEGTTLEADIETDPQTQHQLDTVMPRLNLATVSTRTEGPGAEGPGVEAGEEVRKQTGSSYDQKPRHISDKQHNRKTDQEFNKTFYDQSNTITESGFNQNVISEQDLDQITEQPDSKISVATVNTTRPDGQEYLVWGQPNNDFIDHQFSSNSTSDITPDITPGTTRGSRFMPRDEEYLPFLGDDEVEYGSDVASEASVASESGTVIDSPSSGDSLTVTSLPVTVPPPPHDLQTPPPPHSSLRSRDVEMQQSNAVSKRVSADRSSGCDLNSLPAHLPYDERLLLGSWLIVGSLHGHLPYSSARLLIVRLATDSSTLIFHYTGSTSGLCVGTRRLLARQTQHGVYDTSSATGTAGQLKIVYIDSSQAVIHYCGSSSSSSSSTYDSAHCPSSSSLLLLLTRGSAPQHISPAWIAGLGMCAHTANNLQLIRHSDNCQIRATSQISLIKVADNFRMEQLIGTWYSVLQYGRKSPTDTLVLRFHKDNNFDDTIGTSTGIRNQVCRTAINFTLEDHGRAEWKPLLLGQQVLVKVLWLDESYMIWYECRAEDRYGECAPDSLTLSVLHKQAPALGETFIFSEIIKNLPVHVLLGTGLQLQDFTVSHHFGSCPMPKIRKNVCRFEDIPAVTNIDYNQLGGVWHSRLILKGSRYLEYTTAIIQPARSRSLLAIIRTFRDSDCLPAETAVLSSIEGLAGSGSFQAKFRTHKSLMKILYTDYDYTLTYECLDEVQGDICPYPQAVLYGRVKDEVVPDEMLRKIFDNVSDLSCLYFDDFIPAISPDDCSLPYSGRRSCRLDDVLTHESFEEREMLGTWQLLTRTQSVTTNSEQRDTAETIRFSLDSADGISYSSSALHPSGACTNVRGSITSVGGANATYSIDSQFRKIDIFKVLFMNAQYMVMYVCKNYYAQSSPVTFLRSSTIPTCPSDLQEVKVYGRSYIMSTSVQRMLTDISKHKTCVNLDRLVDANFNNKCDLPEGCTVRDYITQEQFNISMMEGTWQLLLKSRFRLSDAHPTSVKFKVEKTSTRRNNAEAVLVQDIGKEGCNSETITLEPAALYYEHLTKDGTFVLRHLDKRQQQHTSLLQILWTDASYFVSLLCVGGATETGECPAERAELMVWGRAWHMTTDVRKRVLHEAGDRTLRCYAVTSMIDVSPNDACSMSTDECSMDQFRLHAGVKRDEILGWWYLAAYARDSDAGKEQRSRDVMRIALSDDTYHFTVTSHITSRPADLMEARGSCDTVSGTARTYSEDHKSTFITTRRSMQDLATHAVSQVIHLSTSYLVLLECLDTQSVHTYCSRQELRVWSRADDVIHPDVLKDLMTHLRLNTHSCVATRSVVSTTSHNDDERCEAREPVEGSEVCGYGSMRTRIGVESLVERMSGLWFEQMRSTRVDQLNSEASVIHAHVSSNVLLTLRGAFHNRSRCVSYSNVGRLISTDSMIWSFQSSDVNATLKVIDLEDDHMVIYGCQGNTVSDGDSFVCAYGNEHLTVYSRKRFISSEQRERLQRLVQHSTCFSLTQVVTSQHYEKCRIPTVLEYGNEENKPCRVSDYPVTPDFNLNMFGGIWYELERLRVSYHNIWESGVMKLSIHPPSTLLISHAGSRGDRCFGPVHAYAQPQSVERDGGSDMTLWLGHMSLHGNPWTASISSRLKIVWTDYERAALLYVCHGVSDNGTCRAESQQLYILSRDKRIHPTVLQTLYDVITDHMCVDVHDLVTTQHDAADCLEYVDPEAAAARDRVIFDQSHAATVKHISEMTSPAVEYSSPTSEVDESRSPLPQDLHTTTQSHQLTSLSDETTPGPHSDSAVAWIEPDSSLQHQTSESISTATSAISLLPDQKLDITSEISDEEELVDKRDSLDTGFILPSQHRPSYDQVVESQTFDFEQDYRQDDFDQNLYSKDDQYTNNQHKEIEHVNDQNRDNIDIYHSESDAAAGSNMQTEYDRNPYNQDHDNQDHFNQEQNRHNQNEQHQNNQDQSRQDQNNQDQSRQDQNNQDQSRQDQNNQDQSRQYKHNQNQNNNDQDTRDQYQNRVERKPYYHNEYNHQKSWEQPPHSWKQQQESWEQPPHSWEQHQHLWEQPSHSVEPLSHLGEQWPPSGEQQQHSWEQQRHSEKQRQHLREQRPGMDEETKSPNDAARIVYNNDLYTQVHESSRGSATDTSQSPAQIHNEILSQSHELPPTSYTEILTTTEASRTTTFDRILCPIPMCSRNCLIAVDERGCETCDCSSPTHILPPTPPPLQRPPPEDLDELISFHPNTEVVQEVRPIIEDIADYIDFTSEDSSLVESKQQELAQKWNNSLISEISETDTSSDLT